jgi:diguanylate cyclase (GGDEF)-like protein
VGTEAARGGFGAVVMLDLDNLKVANDTWGHATGDALLRRAADVLRAATRPSDRLYRWGGDEFLLVLPGARSAEVLPRLEDALSCADAELDPDERGRLRLLASLGAADYAGAEELEDAIRTADLAMYQAKALHKRACATPAPTLADPPLEPAP